MSQDTQDRQDALTHAERLVAALEGRGLRARAWQGRAGSSMRVYLEDRSSMPQYVTVSRGGDVHGHDPTTLRGFGGGLTLDLHSLAPSQRKQFRAALEDYREQTAKLLEQQWAAADEGVAHEQQPTGLFAAALARRAAERARGNPAATEHRVAVATDTGNYEVEVRHKLDHPYWIAVRYTGPYGDMDWVEFDGGVEDYIDEHWVGEDEEDDEPEADRLAAQWLERNVRGDQDVELLLQAAGCDRFGNIRSRINPSAPAYLPLSKIAAWEHRAAERGVSEVARSRRGFLTAYKRAGGRPARLSVYWQRRRAAFIARHMAQAQNEQLWQNGEPSRRHLALIMWAYSPTPARL